MKLDLWGALVTNAAFICLLRGIRAGCSLGSRAVGSKYIFPAECAAAAWCHSVVCKVDCGVAKLYAIKSRDGY